MLGLSLDLGLSLSLGQGLNKRVLVSHDFRFRPVVTHFLSAEKLKYGNSECQDQEKE